MPPTLKSGGHIALGMSVCASMCLSVQKNFKARVLNFHIWIPSHIWIYGLPVFFFLSELSPLAELCPF